MTDSFRAVQDLADIGNKLERFPERVGDECRYEYGLQDPSQHRYRYLLIRAYTTDAAGHCAIQVKMNNNWREPDEGVCEFSIQAEAAAINRLGSLLKRFSKWEHLELLWQLDGEELFADLQFN